MKTCSQTCSSHWCSIYIYCPVVLMEGSGWRALCKSWCTYVCTCTHKQHSSDKGGKKRVKQTLQCKIIIKWKSEQRKKRKKKESVQRDTEGRGDRKPRSVADYDKAMSLIFCPSCRGSQEQLQWQGSIRSAVPLLHSPSRSIINDTEKQGRSCRARCPAHAGATGGGEGGRHTLREMDRGRAEDMLLALLVHQFMLKGTRDR